MNLLVRGPELRNEAGKGERATKAANRTGATSVFRSGVVSKPS